MKRLTDRVEAVIVLVPFTIAALLSLGLEPGDTTHNVVMRALYFGPALLIGSGLVIARRRAQRRRHCT